MRRARILTILFSVAFTGSTRVQASDRPADYSKRIPGWTIAGDFDAGGCIAIMETDLPTSLSIASLPNRSKLIFSVQNPQWSSIADDESMRINAIFRIKGRAVDGWSLAAVGMNATGAKPGFKFEIENAKNDSASFPDQFSRSDSLELFNDKIPVGKFNLVGSSQAIGLLFQCRAKLRGNPNFDPFAK